MNEYLLFYKDLLDPERSWDGLGWDVFLSPFNGSERVQRVFEKVEATQKHWLVHPEYGYAIQEYPQTGMAFAPTSLNEAEFLREYLDASGVDLTVGSICVDITGFMRPHLLFLLYYLHQMGVQRFDVLYSEPGYYSKKEKTTFSDGPVVEVRQIAGYEGAHSADTSRDVLVLGSGYDRELMKSIAEDKENARKLQLFGFPSLRPEMYQENILQAHHVTEAIGRRPGNYPGNYFAPASDPFVTAGVLSNVVRGDLNGGRITNLYLCPTGTKVQALGFGLFYLHECIGGPVSIVSPFREGYARETTKGISRVWRYVVEF